MTKITNTTNETDHEEDLAGAGKLLVVRLWLAGAAVAVATCLAQLHLGG